MGNIETMTKFSRLNGIQDNYLEPVMFLKILQYS